MPYPALSRFKPGRLLLVDARSGAVETLADGMYKSLDLSPDGHTLAAQRLARKVQPDPVRPDIDWTFSRAQLVLIDLQKKSPPRVVTPELDVFPETLAWSNDGGKLAYFGWKIGDTTHSGRFRAVDVATGAVAAYPHRGLDLTSERERGLAQKPERVLWVGDRLAMWASESKDGDPTPRFTDREIHRDEVPDDARSDWFLVDRNGAHEKLTGTLRKVSPIPVHADASGFAVLAEGGVWMLAPGQAPERVQVPDGVTLSLTHEDQYTTLTRSFPPSRPFLGRSATGSSIVFVDFRTRTARAVPVQSPNVNPLALSSQEGAILYHDVTAANDAVLLQRGSGAPETMRRLNPHLDAVARTVMRRLDYQVSDENGVHKVAGCMLLPPDYQPGRRYPVIVDVYTGRGAGRCNDTLVGPTRLDAQAMPCRSISLRPRATSISRPACCPT